MKIKSLGIGNINASLEMIVQYYIALQKTGVPLATSEEIKNGIQFDF